MPHRLLNALVRLFPRAVIEAEELAAKLKLTRVQLRGLVRKGERLGTMLWWGDVASVVLDPSVAEERGYELWSNDTPDPQPEDWKWIKIGQSPRIKSKGFAGLGCNINDPDPMDQIPVIQPVYVDAESTVRKWLAHAATTSEPGVKPDGPPKRGRKPRADWNGFNLGEAQAVRLTPAVRVRECTCWRPAIEVAGRKGCGLCKDGADLDAIGLCLACLRSGFDALLPKVKASEKPRHYAPDPSGLAGGVGSRKAAG